MSTHATIAMEYPDGTVRGVYLHNDGYVTEAGFVLYAYYRTPEVVQQLIALGHLSVLGVRIGHKVDMNDRTTCMSAMGQCFSYARDGSEALGIYQESDWDAFRCKYAEDYIYLYRCKDNTWYMRGPRMARLGKLSNALHAANLRPWDNRFADGRCYTKPECQIGTAALKKLRTTV